MNLNKHLFKEDLYSQQTPENMFISLVIREMEIKTTWRYYLMPIMMATIQEPENNVSVEAWRNWKPHAFLGGM